MIKHMLEKYIKQIKTSIDRLELSLPCLRLKEFLKILADDCKQLHFDKDNEEKKYWYQHFKYKGILLTVKGMLPEKMKLPNHNPRFWVTVSDPNIEVQMWLKGVCRNLSRGSPKGRYSVIIKEVELAIDFYTDEKNEAEKIWRYIGKHLFIKHSRSNSYRTIKTTRYIGRNGNIRDGTKGVRCYPKTIRRKTLCRLEKQYNRQYLLERKITYESLPITAEMFLIFDNLVFLNRFLDNGVRNYARDILRKQNLSPSNSNYREELRKKEAYVRLHVLGGTRGSYPAVHKQIGKLKELNKKYDLSANYRKYFNQITADENLINCLIDIGNEEELCSKRLMMVTIETKTNNKKNSDGEN